MPEATNPVLDGVKDADCDVRVWQGVCALVSSEIVQRKNDTTTAVAKN